MKIPLDIKALLEEAINITQARETPVSVHLMIDETASADFQAFVRSGFMSTAAHARLLISYFPTQMPTVVTTDMVVIAAGVSDTVGSLAALFQEAGMPVLVVAEQPQKVLELARESGNKLDAENVVSPKVGQPFNEEIKGDLADEIGSWIVKMLCDKRLAFSMAYPFVRKPLAQEAVSATAIQNAGVGLVVFVPGADMPVMTLNQAKMILQIAAAYNQPLGPERVKELAATFASALVFRGISRQMVALIPALGWAIKAVMGYTGTKAIGNAAIAYFEKGGNLSGLASIITTTQEKIYHAVSFFQEQPRPQEVAEIIGEGAGRFAHRALGEVEPLARSASQAVSSVLSVKGVRRLQRAKKSRKKAKKN